jgi:hypothetical protein
MAPIGTSVNVFQASIRLATIGNLRGTLSMGSASNVVTRTAPLVDDLRRNGSKKTVKPDAAGNKPMMMPITVAKVFLKKPRRSDCGRKFCECIASIACDFQAFADLPENFGKGKCESRFETVLVRIFCVLLRKKNFSLRP